MDGTLGAVKRVLFRESVRKTALEAGRASARSAGWLRSKEAVTARPPSYVELSGVGRHGAATVGVRVSQVGVNPLRRAVVVGGIERAEKPERSLA
jgi:hypothetical protein